MTGTKKRLLYFQLQVFTVKLKICLVACLIAVAKTMKQLLQNWSFCSVLKSNVSYTKHYTCTQLPTRRKPKDKQSMASLQTRGLVSKETAMVLHQWGSETQKFGFFN